ncbi:MAG: hypothetical protein O2968_20555 [Acidobacteria bacterium]|nr:hypothetical protein [Acidobacteriota bacterium]
MTTFRQLRYLVCLGVFGALSHAPVARLTAASDDHGLHSGTYRGRVITEQFLHEQSQARRSKAKAALTAEPPAMLRDDAGNIAVIDTSGGVVIEPNSFDLANVSLSFVPAAGGYTSTPAASAFDEQARDGGIPIPLGDDDAQPAALPFSFPYFGREHTQAFIHSDGNLTFEGAEASSTSRSLSRATSGPPRIAPLFTDLDPSRVTNPISTYSTADRFFVTWDAVPIFTSGGIGARQTFQLVLHRDGRIDCHYRSIALTDAVVGIMPGRLEGDTVAADLSEGVSDPAGGALGEIFSSSRDLDTLAAGQKFYQNHDDAYDFLVVFNTLDLNVGGGAFAFELNVRNQVLGIGDLLGGSAVLDFGAQFGSPRRLQSLLNMGPLTNYPSDPAAAIVGLGENNTLTVLSHEAGHRFLAYIDFIDPATGQPSASLLGRQGAHWSFFFNSDASVLEGNRIADRAMLSPRFVTAATVEHFSDLDQYLMGLRLPDEVTPAFLVEQPRNFQQGTRSAASAPQTGINFDGDRTEVSVEMVIAAEGERIPAASVSQRDFNFAFVLLVDRGAEPSAADLQKLDNIRAAWEPFFEQAADLRTDAHTELVHQLHLSTFPASGLVAGSPGTAMVDIAEPLTADLGVMLSADNAGITFPPVVTIPAGSTSVSFLLEGVAAGVTHFSAAASGPGFDTAHTLIDVKAEAAQLRLQVAAGSNQVAGLGGLLPEPVVLRVHDANDLPYPGLAVNLIPSGDGIATPMPAVTDSKGEIRVSWRLATTGESNTLTARLDSAPLVRAVVTAQSIGPLPAFTAASVVGAAGFNLGPSAANTALPAGGIVTIFGLGLGVDTAGATAFPLPTELAGTVVTVNGVRAFLLLVSPTQINLLMPFEIEGEQAEIVITTPAGTSETITVALAEVQPGIFFDAATGLGALRNAANGVSLWEQALPAGAAAAVFCAGLGPVEPAVSSALPASFDPLSLTVLPVEAEIDGRPVMVLFSGLAPGFAGLYQVNIQLPSDLPPGRYLLVIRVGGLISNEVFIDIE